MPLAIVTFSQLLNACAPNIGSRTMTALVRVESGGNPFAIRDNTVGRSFNAIDAREAAAWARQLLGQHHNVDLGLSQINSANLGKLGMSVDEAFDSCTNLHGGATILSYDYRAAVQKFGAGQFALRRAIGAYNTGSLFEGDAYVSQILAAAGISAPSDFRVPDVGAIAAPRSFLFNEGLRAAAHRHLPAKPALAATARTEANLRTPFNAPLLVTNGGGSVSAPLLSPSATPAETQTIPANAAALTPPSQSGILVPVIPAQR